MVINGGTVDDQAEGAIAINKNNTATADWAIAMGRTTTASGSSSTAMGFFTTASGQDSTAMGSGTTASGNYSTAMGSGTIASSVNSTAMGFFTTASGQDSTAMGSGTTASGNYSTAMGRTTTASGNYSTAMGSSTTASGFSSTAMGFDTTASGQDSTAMGSGTTASGNYSTAMGHLSEAQGENSLAASGGIAKVANTIAMGVGATAELEHSIALGNGSVANTAAGAVGYLGTNKTGATWTSTANAISIGDAANDVTRQLTGLAAGTADTDAVNVAQLKAVTQKVESLVSNSSAALRGEINRVRRDAHSGTAAAMAVANLGQPYKPAQTAFGLSGAIYQGRVGMAAGLSRITESGKFLFKGAVNTNNDGKFGAAVSATYYFD